MGESVKTKQPKPTTIDLVMQFYSTQKYPVSGKKCSMVIGRNATGVYQAIGELESMGCLTVVKGFGAIPTGKPYYKVLKMSDSGKDGKTIDPFNPEFADTLEASFCGELGDMSQLRKKRQQAIQNIGKGIVFIERNPGQGLAERMQS